MNHRYTVTGMTCNGCRTSVEDKLNTIPEVDSVSVNLETGEASITMSKHISIQELQSALPDKYSILEKK